jgi:hypothetical protein
MKNFNTVYNNSKQQVLKERAAMFESQKVAIVNVLKENYMITGNISDLPVEEQKQFATRLLEYWSPKTGIKKEGVALLNENMLTLSPASNKEDIKLYIEKQVKKHLVAITEAYRQNNVGMVTEAIKADVEPMIHKTLKESFVNNIVWNLISDRIRLGLD